jgi:hypothetical protein
LPRRASATYGHDESAAGGDGRPRIRRDDGRGLTGDSVGIGKDINFHSNFSHRPVE